MAAASAMVASGVAIGRARVRGPGASRALLEDALGAVALDGLGLGPDEVLYVPRLAGPARLRPGEARHFARGLELALGDLARGAQRDPIAGGGSDRAYRFSSRAAFTAWLIGAVLDSPGAAAASLVHAATGRASPEDWWRRDLLPDGRALVALLARLATRGLADRWLASLDPGEVAIGAAALARDYALPAEGAHASPAANGAIAAGSLPALAMAGLSRSARAALPEVVAAVATLAPAASAPPPLSAPARRLLVSAATLARAPGLPRTALIEAVSHVLATTAGFDPPSGTAPLTDRGSAIAQDADRAATPSTPSEATLARPTRAVPLADMRKSPRIRVVETARGPQPTLPAPPAEPALTAHEAPHATAWDPFPEPSDAPEATPSLPPRSAFETRFGGLVFLLNAFLAMGFYPDFTRPLDPALAIAPLAIADRLGLHWFGARYRRDPLHHWIARRANRARTPRRWQVSRDWLQPFPGGGYRQDGGTLWHSVGFPLANRTTAMPARRLAHALGVAPAARSQGRTPTGHGHDPDWIECLALFLAARFQRATAGGTLTPAMLAIPARCVAAEDRFDLTFALDRLPLELRLAGLDRDPGWLPTQGCDVRFHFA